METPKLGVTSLIAIDPLRVLKFLLNKIQPQKWMPGLVMEFPCISAEVPSNSLLTLSLKVKSSIFPESM